MVLRLILCFNTLMAIVETNLGKNKTWEERQSVMDLLIEKWKASARDPKFLEKAEELQRELSRISPEDWIRPNNI